MTIADAEIVYDDHLLPLRAWRRLTIPGVRRADGNADIRRYEFRTPEVTVTRRLANGTRDFEIIRGARPRAVLATGRGSVTAWIQRARLPIGGRLREWVFDMRQPLEELREVTLRRERDLYVPDYRRAVRVYTIYGRDSLFADETDSVIGDLGGSRPHELLGTPAPPPMPMYGTPDPLRTP